MKKIGALMVMLSAISFAVFSGCQGEAGTGGGDAGGETGGGDDGGSDDGADDGGSDEK